MVDRVRTAQLQKQRREVLLVGGTPGGSATFSTYTTATCVLPIIYLTMRHTKKDSAMERHA